MQAAEISMDVSTVLDVTTDRCKWLDELSGGLCAFFTASTMDLPHTLSLLSALASKETTRQRSHCL